ncbi:hypothetical protein Goklo_022964 [Gossypium klotzschianum]|nr:hypothetical protein [Gossypium klotzschianum]
MVATTWDKLLRAAKNCDKRAMLYMFVNQISMLGSVLDDDWPVEAEKQAMQEDEVPFFPMKKKHIKKGQLAGLIEALGVIAATIGVTTDDDSLDFLDGGSTD